MSSKNTERKKFRQILRNIPDQDILHSSKEICHRIATQFSSVKSLAIYAAQKQEVSLQSLHALLPHTQLLYPLCHPERKLSFHLVKKPNELQVGKYGIDEPLPEKHPLLPLSEIEIILCPGLAFTPRGIRLGHGGGYYDRVLENFHGITCGIALHQQITPHLPTQPHDILMQHIITDQKIYHT